MLSHFLAGIQCHFPVQSAGSGDYIQPADRIALNEVSFGRKAMCSLRLANALNASRLCLPMLPQMGFILAFQERTGQGTKAETRYCSPLTRVEKQL